MGRKPNPLIALYFERGPKLSDNSNRYPHRCKACGEDFPKGRIDSLTGHLTRKCPAITEAERVEACLTLNGISASGSHAPKAQAQNNGAIAGGVPHVEDNWTALETLAEVSRQIEASEKHDDHAPNAQNPNFESSQVMFTDSLPAHIDSNHFELQELATLENPPSSYENRSQRETRGSEHAHRELTTEEKLHSLLAQVDGAPTESNLGSVAAAATARLNPSFLDPQLQAFTEEPTSQSVDAATTTSEMMADYTSQVTASPPVLAPPAMVPPVLAPPAMAHPVTAPHTASPHESNSHIAGSSFVGPPVTEAPAAGPNHISAWSEMTYIPDAVQAPATVSDQSQNMALTLNKGGFRMDTSSHTGARTRHTRARFDAARRREVQEVRRIGACIRCRILRKNCSKGTPCDTCRKVLSPRVWRTGCVRTKLAEQLELYTAGVQVVISQKRVNKLKACHKLTNNGVVVEASFHETGQKMVLQVAQGQPLEVTQDVNEDSSAPPTDILMIDNDKEDVPAKVENYMRHVVPELIRREPSNHVRVMLECASHVAQETDDELLKRSLDLWGLVEMMHRERHWSFLKKMSDRDSEGVLIKEAPGEHDSFTNLSTQLTAAAERKAAATSKSLLNGIQRHLQDGKTKLGFAMFLTTLVLMNSVEKTTWTFKAWEGEGLQALWPLEKQPSDYYNQGYALCELLRMLLSIRHVLPRVVEPDPDHAMVAEEENEIIRQFYQNLNVSTNFLRSRHENYTFDQTDSRSLEFLYCSHLLMPMQ
ncbi:uncharacterized protein BCR38DRAFT_458208 [Pseudomassariella vexata]|uniref:Uncharacterized protein n=1 Tax=Pseudomassariella vexata TaxID=1141098 RepID=A0A1Y2DWD4_9PEZI|nr:uncharacterized protein BCR38DRAFT_458208 [Pseudomassariella vexata]ORY62935.1 hypothetical protein BCR38DRAFT_458208 [Pseudomassariella vexata]